jgi:hypothetical protein
MVPGYCTPNFRSVRLVTDLRFVRLRAARFFAPAILGVSNDIGFPA